MKHILNWVKKDFISRLNSKKSKFKSVRVAFTLAEVLITLGIIGVVAALTMPTLIQNHQKQVYVTGLKKAYSTLQNGFAKMAFDEGVTDWKDTACGDLEIFGPMLTPDCSESMNKEFNLINGFSVTGCDEDWCKFPVYPEKFLAYDGNPVMQTIDGALYLFTCMPFILVDVNSASKGPNKIGRDIFGFHLDWDKNRIVPFGAQSIEDSFPSFAADYNDKCTTEAVSNNSEDALYCTVKVINEDKMDY